MTGSKRKSRLSSLNTAYSLSLRALSEEDIAHAGPLGGDQLLELGLALGSVLGIKAHVDSAGQRKIAVNLLLLYQLFHRINLGRLERRNLVGCFGAEERRVLRHLKVDVRLEMAACGKIVSLLFLPICSDKSAGGSSSYLLAVSASCSRTCFASFQNAYRRWGGILVQKMVGHCGS